MTKQEAIDYFVLIEKQGWLKLIEILFEKVPENIKIIEVFERWATFEVRYEGEDNKKFNHFLGILKRISNKMCEKCGKLASHTIVDNWEQTLCKLHFEQAIHDKKIGEY